MQAMEIDPPPPPPSSAPPPPSNAYNGANSNGNGIGNGRASGSGFGGAEGEESAPMTEKLIDLYGEDGEPVEIDLFLILTTPPSDSLRLSTSVLANIKALPKSWMYIAKELARAGRWGLGEEVLRVAVRTNFAQTPQSRPNYSALAEVHAMQGYFALARARAAPKMILSAGEAKQDRLPENAIPASHFYSQAAECFRRAEGLLSSAQQQSQQQAGGRGGEEGKRGRLGLGLGKALLALANRDFPTAEQILTTTLKPSPHNLLLLMLLGRLYLSTRRPKQALETYQKVLKLSPSFGLPQGKLYGLELGGLDDVKKEAVEGMGEDEVVGSDPRVGIGLGYWLLGDRERGKKAWERALDLNPNNRSAKFLLALTDFNESRNSLSTLSPEQKNKKLVAATSVMGELFRETKGRMIGPVLGLIRNAELMGQMPRAIKLAERALQYADSVGHFRKAVAERCRLSYLAGEADDIEKYAAKLRDVPEPVVEMVRAQYFIRSGAASYREALNVVDIAIAKIDKNRLPNELKVLHALLLAYPHPGMTPQELAINFKKSRDTLTRMLDAYKATKGKGDSRNKDLRDLGDDPLIFVQLGRMWQDENIARAIEAYQTAIEIYTRNKSESDAPIDLAQRDLTGMRMSNNLGSLYLTQGNIDEAMQMFEQVLSDMGQVEGEDEEILQAILLYNLGRAYEAGKEFDKAMEVYRGLLAKHPEHLYTKIRLSAISTRAGEEDALLKEANAGHPKDQVLRAYVTSYLARGERWTEVSEFAAQSRRVDSDDLQALCALGNFHYQRARESKAPEPERQKDYSRSGEAFARALEVDPTCAVAAQGLAIAIAEDNLPSSKALPTNATDAKGDSIKLKGLDIALGIFTRIRDCLQDKAVLVNIGHCHFFKGDDDRAIEAYSGALHISNDQDGSILLFLSRAYYQQGTKTSSYPALSKALSLCQRATHLRPSDPTLLHNIAMIQQKAAEVVLGLDPSKRSLQEVNQVIEHARSSTSLFRMLADTHEKVTPYDLDLVDQRARYGEGLLRRADDQRERQVTWEQEQTEKHADAVKRRQEERKRLEAIETERRRAAQAKLDEEARIREAQRAEAQTWREELRQQQEEEERARAERAEMKQMNKGKRGRKDRAEDGFIDEGGVGEDGEPRPPKRSKKKKAVDPDDEGEAMASGNESRSPSRSRSVSKAPKPKKKRPAAIDPDGDDPIVPDKPAKRTKFKSKEFIESEEEDE